jgi:hypothetical protein
MKLVFHISEDGFEYDSGVGRAWERGWDILSFWGWVDVSP